MAAKLDGIAFQQIYGDNSGGAEFDTDGDGTTTQEDEFVSVINTTGAPVDISGWQIWSDSTGTGAPDSVQDGLYHTFPSGTVVAPGDSLYVINEISDPGGKYFGQEASQGGTESGAGGSSTNYLSEGTSNTSDEEAMYLVNPSTGDYIVFNMGENPPDLSNIPGFPGTNQVGIIDGTAVQNDQNAGSSYQYNANTDSYEYGAVYVPCFMAGTGIATPDGQKSVETLRPGDLVLTHEGHERPVRAVITREVRFTSAAMERHRPILFAIDSLGPGQPFHPLSVSPQHKMLVPLPKGEPVLVPAKALLRRRGVRRRMGLAKVRYVHLLLDAHEVVLANGAPSESFWPGPYGQRTLPPALSAMLRPTTPPRKALSVREGLAALP